MSCLFFFLSLGFQTTLHAKLNFPEFLSTWIIKKREKDSQALELWIVHKLWMYTDFQLLLLMREFTSMYKYKLSNSTGIHSAIGSIRVNFADVCGNSDISDRNISGLRSQLLRTSMCLSWVLFHPSSTSFALFLPYASFFYLIPLPQHEIAVSQILTLTWPFLREGRNGDQWRPFILIRFERRLLTCEWMCLTRKVFPIVFHNARVSLSLSRKKRKRFTPAFGEPHQHKATKEVLDYTLSGHYSSWTIEYLCRNLREFENAPALHQGNFLFRNFITRISAERGEQVTALNAVPKFLFLTTWMTFEVRKKRERERERDDTKRNERWWRKHQSEGATKAARQASPAE